MGQTGAGKTTLVDSFCNYLFGIEFYDKFRYRLVDEKALYTALSQGYIAGAGLDVMETEPPSLDNPLFQLGNVMITGHNASYSEQANAEMFRGPWEEVARILSGEWPRSLVNPQVKENFLARWGGEHEAPGDS